MPNLYLGESHFRQVREKLDSGSEIHNAAWEFLRQRAETEALNAPLLSVRHNDGSPHFRCDITYVKDGVFDENANRKSVGYLEELSRHTLDLAVAYRISGKERFAEKALEFIHAWCIDMPTRMYPDGRVDGPATPGYRMNGEIGFFMRLNDFFLACYLLDDFPGWDLDAHQATREWVRSMVEAQRGPMFYNGYRMTNNWEDARLLYLAKGALFLDDLKLLIQVFDTWKRNLPIKMTPEGQLPRETERTRSMTYTLAALDMMVETAEIAKAYGVDLYGFDSQGRSLKTGLNYALRHMLDFESWPFEQLEGLENVRNNPHHRRFLEMAHRHWGDPACLEVIELCGGRPVRDGHATLLFA